MISGKSSYEKIKTWIENQWSYPIINEQITQVAEKNPPQSQAVPEKALPWVQPPNHSTMHSSVIPCGQCAQHSTATYLPAWAYHTAFFTATQSPGHQSLFLPFPYPFFYNLAKLCSSAVTVYYIAVSPNLPLRLWPVPQGPLFVLMVIESPSFSWSHGNLALKLPFPAFFASYGHMTKLW